MCEEEKFLDGNICTSGPIKKFKHLAIRDWQLIMMPEIIRHGRSAAINGQASPFSPFCPIWLYFNFQSLEWSAVV